MNLRGLLVAIILILPVSVFGQPPADSRACNLQAREIALRISEEVSSDMSAAERGQIVAIVEDVCMKSAPLPRVARPNPLNARPAPAEPETQEMENVVQEEIEEEDDGGLLGGLRIIDPEDRVKRPGLKRK